MASSITEDLILRPGKVLVLQDVVKAKEKISAAGVIEELAVGPQTKASSGVVVNRASDVSVFKIGDRLLFSPYSGFALAYKGDGRYLLLGEHEIFAHFSGEVGDVEIR